MTPTDPAELPQAGIWLREGLLLAGFLVLLGLAAWTVAVPELSEAHEPTASAKTATSTDAGTGP